MVVSVPSRQHLRRTLAVFALSVTGFGAAPAGAQDASPWVTDQHSAVRLIAGSRNDGVLLGGIAFKLHDEWKTYWRTPGDSGVPPRFDFSNSDNVASVTVLWPAPMQFPDGAGGTSFGYKHHLVLPLRIMAKQPDKPVTLRADISYAVCDKLCVPVEAKGEVAFASSASTEDATLLTALQAVPQPARIGDTNVLAVRAVKREGDKVIVEVAAPANTDTALFVEGPTLDWALPPPQLVNKTPEGHQRFSFALEGLPSGAKAEGAALKLTLVGGGHAYEIDTTLD
ncbi:cytochrome C biogenesis protein [Bradyrhizobium sp. U87765 SZCCT0131]|uniref:protein-disulfide reductase DsbD domain-containing protein n=1 Tax=Bradyrhizobium sp. U87765 SZCCT0109 TaxID=2807656 RepID=UPI001BAD6C0A|nr:cytochrome C biogenesis protein [Bradyrhizobium sp. U87765 SZCCT0131]MBR1260311.1 cytochrome C biogenesis protein [Bradyrhizobium sp. U87765 SZCCT0134]MBR1307440.1 cytochrome C biogenesis protein [Bradyrhizobium sp. U87765 SZCCT0110]MBR1321394.1 cytochrome C biogenesis protein [Bradyrhizobium sp. U87765 SZCCT0109]MBR1349707.1 cytochrome C biogenesis protein [Bradyrhizobium sp. U87765 SZCCT0048]